MQEGKYGKIFSQFWNDEKVLKWSDDEKLICIYILSCEHYASEGLYRLPIQYASADLNWTFERTKKAIKGLIDNKFISYDFDSNIILIIKALKFYNPNGTNQKTAFIKRLKKMPKTNLMIPFLWQCKKYNPELEQEVLHELFENTPTGIPEEYYNYPINKSVQTDLDLRLNGFGKSVQTDLDLRSNSLYSYLYTHYSYLYTQYSNTPSKTEIINKEQKAIEEKINKEDLKKEEFEKYWDKEPVKSDKKRTYKNILKLIKENKIEIESLISYRFKYLDSIKNKTDPQYWKHPANFFGQDGTWEDWINNKPDAPNYELKNNKKDKLKDFISKLESEEKEKDDQIRDGKIFGIDISDIPF